ncbi:MAG: CvpA family protein [Deltaproteobacteria bacterium]|nr:CvpA family protein [Deltaproteobacteria bacterium]
MNLVDILIWVVLLSFAVKGFMKGLVKEVCSFLGLIVGGWAAFTYYRPFAGVLQSHSHFSHTITLFLSFGLILLALGLFFFLLGYLLTTLLKIIFLGSANRIGGVFLGVVQGSLVLCMLFSLGTAKMVPLKIRSCIEKSATARPFLFCGREILAWWKAGSNYERRNDACVSIPAVRDKHLPGTGATL